MTTAEEDKRLNDILEMIGRVAALDFSRPLSTSNKNDMVDAIALGLNMLSEELSTNVVEKSKLDRINSKLEKFAFTTAHDLRSPLNSITGLVTLLELHMDRKQHGDLIEYVNKIRSVTEQMKLLVQGILDYSRSAAEMEKEPIDVQTVVSEIMEVDQLHTRARVHFNSELPLVHFHPSSMRQVIRNLLGNAVKYCDKEVCIIEISCEEWSGRHCFKVRDNGPGIALEDQEKIFNLFNKVEATTRADSHGIGLATIRSVLEGSGEKIWVESQPGEGATFCFTLVRRYGHECISGNIKD